MMDTDETIARYTRLKETHEAHVDPADIKPETLAIWQLLDRIAQLEEKNRRLQILLDEANDFMVNDSNQAHFIKTNQEILEALKQFPPAPQPSPDQP